MQNNNSNSINSSDNGDDGNNSNNSIFFISDQYISVYNTVITRYRKKFNYLLLQ